MADPTKPMICSHCRKDTDTLTDTMLKTDLCPACLYLYDMMILNEYHNVLSRDKLRNERVAEKVFEDLCIPRAEIEALKPVGKKVVELKIPRR